MRSQAKGGKKIAEEMGHRMLFWISGIPMAAHENLAEALGRNHFEMQRGKAYAAEPRGFSGVALLGLAGSAAQRCRLIDRRVIRATLHLKRKGNPVPFSDGDTERLRVEQA